MGPSTSITVSIPTRLSEELGQLDLSRLVTESLVLEFVRRGLLSIGEAGGLLDLGYFETERLLKERGIPLVLTEKEFEQDQADLAQIVERQRSA